MEFSQEPPQVHPWTLFKSPRRIFKLNSVYHTFPIHANTRRTLCHIMIFSSTRSVNSFHVIQVPTQKALAACFAIVRYTALEKNAEETFNTQIQE